LRFDLAGLDTDQGKRGSSDRQSPRCSLPGRQAITRARYVHWDNDHRRNSSTQAPVVRFANNSLRQGAQMIDQSELKSRAALCRELAQREPANRTLWMAEAESWARLSQEKSQDENSVTLDSGILTRLSALSAKFQD
jgi:hypothetical protein